MSQPPIQPSAAAVRGDDTRPRVDLPPTGLPTPVVFLAFAVLAAGLFAVLNGHRQPFGQSGPESAKPSPAAMLAQAQPILPLEVPPPPVSASSPAQALSPSPAQIQYIERPGPPPPPVIQYVQQPATPPSPSHGDSRPALVIDLVSPPPAQANDNAADSAAAVATVLHNRSSLVPEGTLIPAVLETPIESMQPGPVRALTTGDTRGFDGSKVLIPYGSRLLGDFHSDVQNGQRRVLVTWNRLIRPDGVAIRLSSPGSDLLGGAGLPGDVNNHILARAGAVVLQTALVIAGDLASRPNDGGVVVSLPGQTVAGAAQPLIPTPDSKPTIKVRAGAAITVFVARDLDFSGAQGRP